VDGAEGEAVGEAGLAGSGIQSAGGGEFGGGVEQARDQEGHDVIALGAGVGIEELVQVQLAQRAQGGGDMAVRERARDGKGLGEVGGSEGLALEEGAEGVDASGRPMGEVGEGAVFDFAVLAVGLAEEDSGRGVAVGDGSHVHAYLISQISNNIKQYFTSTCLHNKGRI